MQTVMQTVTRIEVDPFFHFEFQKHFEVVQVQRPTKEKNEKNGRFFIRQELGQEDLHPFEWSAGVEMNFYYVVWDRNRPMRFHFGILFFFVSNFLFGRSMYFH